MEQLTKNQAVATSQEAVQNQNEPQLRDENAHNDKSVHGVLNPTYQAGLRRDAVQPDIEAEDRKSGSAGMPRPISYAVFCLKKKKVGGDIVVSYFADVEYVDLAIYRDIVGLVRHVCTYGTDALHRS